jgi:hypothetical protein
VRLRLPCHVCGAHGLPKFASLFCPKTPPDPVFTGFFACLRHNFYVTTTPAPTPVRTATRTTSARSALLSCRPGA